MRTHGSTFGVGMERGRDGGACPAARASRFAARLAPGGAVFAVVAALVLAAPSAIADVRTEVARAVREAKLGQATVGISVIDLETGESLASVSEGVPLIPASNMKLITSGAALVVLGPDFVFRTEFHLVGDRLVILGSGDPGLADPALLRKKSPPQTADDVLDEIVRAVKGAGVAFLSEVVADARVFDRQFVHPSWPADQLNKWYEAEVCGLIFHTNVLEVFTSPGAGGPGSLARISIQPRCDWIDLDVRARTEKEGRTSVWAWRDATANRFRIEGRVTAPQREPFSVTVHDNAAFFGELLAERLAAAGVRVGDGSRSARRCVRVAGGDEPIAAGRVLHAIETTMPTVLERCNTDSHNLYAEAMLKRMGRDVTREPGSWANGSAVVRMVVSEVLGPSYAAATVVSDGSGLSRENRVTPETLTRWLGALSRDPRVAEAFFGSMATTGSGALRHRFTTRKPDNDLRAKTGYINNVRALSGIVSGPGGGGGRIAFSVLVNGAKAGEQDEAAKRLQEQVVLILDKAVTAQAAAAEAASGG